MAVRSSHDHLKCQWGTIAKVPINEVDVPKINRQFAAALSLIQLN